MFLSHNGLLLFTYSFNISRKGERNPFLCNFSFLSWRRTFLLIKRCNEKNPRHFFTHHYYEQIQARMYQNNLTRHNSHHQIRLATFLSITKCFKYNIGDQVNWNTWLLRRNWKAIWAVLWNTKECKIPVFDCFIMV